MVGRVEKELGFEKDRLMKKVWIVWEQISRMGMDEVRKALHIQTNFYRRNVGNKVDSIYSSSWKMVLNSIASYENS